MVVVKNLPANGGNPRDPCFHLWVGKIPWSRKWQLVPVFLPGEFHEQRNLAGYSPWGHRESDTTEWLTLSLYFLLLGVWPDSTLYSIILLFVSPSACCVLWTESALSTFPKLSPLEGHPGLPSSASQESVFPLLSYFFPFFSPSPFVFFLFISNVLKLW